MNLRSWLDVALVAKSPKKKTVLFDAKIVERKSEIKKLAPINGKNITKIFIKIELAKDFVPNVDKIHT